MEYYVQVDTGSSAFWVNCIPCKQCPRKSDILKKLTLYDPRSSVSSKVVKCDDMFCTSPDRDVQPECNTSLLCPFIATYADGGSTIGAFVTDLVHYNQLSGNGLTQSTNTSLTFGDQNLYLYILYIDIDIEPYIIHKTRPIGSFS